ncbi:hypothetical protein C8A00DRAFT_18110 [Chaetomidium leptoderma]|uniref:Rhodopsin domain-containing protein n=1 Tax=Chaetomidium leptoderma TaxID=669021 RepID=A0AAN6VGF7_9PEZI|nr:hypothetical protein C8A00DRAFT_18110 [Chaetomidium leptoderma]
MPATDAALAPDPGRWHESRGYQLITAAIVCPIFAVIFTALRIYTRLALIKKHFWEDFSIVVALLSILLQYARVSVMPSDKRLCHVLIAVLCTGYLVFIVLRMVRCIPFHAQWTPGIPGARCDIYNNTWFMFASQGWNMVMDFVILLTPLYILRHSNAPLRQRVLIGVVLAFGGSACIISIIRLHTLYPSTTSADPSWDKVPSAIYGLVETNVGISCASVVTLRPLFHCVHRSLSKKADTSQQTEIVMPQHPVRRRFSDDLVLMTGNDTQVGSEGHDVELGGRIHNHSDCSSTGSNKTGERRDENWSPTPKDLH